jgi:hypothetical protein
MLFSLSEKQVKKYKEWLNIVKQVSINENLRSDGYITFSFSQTGLGEVVIATYKTYYKTEDSINSGQPKEFTINLTEYGTW